MADRAPAPALHEQLRRWVAEGLIDAGQAERIEAAEAARDRAGPPGPGERAAGVPGGRPAGERPAGVAGEPSVGGRAVGPARRTPLVAEALGYAGGVLAIAAGFVAVSQLWPDIPVTAELAFAAGATVVLAAGGAAVRPGPDPAPGRLRSALWLMSTVSLAAFMGVLAAQIWELSPPGTALVAAAAATMYGCAAWLVTRAALQHLAVFAGAATVAGSGVAQVAPGLGAWGPGLAIWVLSALWGIAVFRGYATPAGAGYLAAGAGLLVGAELTMQAAAGHVLALGTVAGLLAAGVALRRVWLLVLGAGGVLLVVPQTAARYLPASAAAPVAVFVVGLVLLGVALWLANSRRWPRSR